MATGVVETAANQTQGLAETLGAQRAQNGRLCPCRRLLNNGDSPTYACGPGSTANQPARCRSRSPGRQGGWASGLGWGYPEARRREPGTKGLSAHVRWSRCARDAQELEALSRHCGRSGDVQLSCPMFIVCCAEGMGRPVVRNTHPCSFPPFPKQSGVHPRKSRTIGLSSY